MKNIDTAVHPDVLEVITLDLEFQDKLKNIRRWDPSFKDEMAKKYRKFVKIFNGKTKKLLQIYLGDVEDQILLEIEDTKHAVAKRLGI
jgi:hypothetical protein